MEMTARKTELTYASRFTLSEDGVNEDGEEHEMLGVLRFGFAVEFILVVEIEGLESFPEVAITVGDERGCLDGGFGWEEGEDVAEYRVW